MGSGTFRRCIAAGALAGMLFVSVVAHAVHPQFHAGDSHGCGVRACRPSGAPASSACGDGRHDQAPATACGLTRASGMAETPPPTHMAQACPICAFLAHYKARCAPLPASDQVVLRCSLAETVPPEQVVGYDVCLSLLGPRSPPAVA